MMAVRYTTIVSLHMFNLKTTEMEVQYVVCYLYHQVSHETSIGTPDDIHQFFLLRSLLSS
jgi:hypothetical protein